LQLLIDTFANAVLPLPLTTPTRAYTHLHAQTHRTQTQGEVVILNPPLGAPLPAFKGPNIMAPDSEATADYFCRRKIGIVNGMHTTVSGSRAVASSALAVVALHCSSHLRLELQTSVLS
jgi:hypothetical protein